MSTCERCNGSGFEDSGGVQPWGEPILVECECRLMERNMDESITDEELSNLGFYSGEATRHPDPNYQLEFDKLASLGVIYAICKELQSYRAAGIKVKERV